MRVFLLHGMARTTASMSILAYRLRRAGHQTTSFGYHTLVEDVDAMAARLARRVTAVLAKDGDGGEQPVPYAVVGHSLGNVITRLASPDLPPGFARFIMLAPPNQPPVVAAALKENFLFRLITRDAGRKLTDPDFFAQLPQPDVPTLIIAGTRGLRAAWLPFHGEVNDGIVRLEETRLDGVPRIEVKGIHSFLMNRRDVCAEILRFLAG